MARSVLIRQPLKPRRWVDAAVVAVLLLVVGAMSYGVWWMVYCAFTRPYSQELLREQWTADRTLDRLKSFADGVLSGSARLPSHVSDRPIVPEPARLNSIYPIHNAERELIAIAFELGGADNHHGLIIGQRPESWWPIPAQWGDTVWWYDGIPELDERSHRRLAAVRRR